MGHKVEPPAVPEGVKTKAKGSIGNPKRGLWCPMSNVVAEWSPKISHIIDGRIECPDCHKKLKPLMVTQKKSGPQTRYPYHYQSR
jgi:hypothetical protein